MTERPRAAAATAPPLRPAWLAMAAVVCAACSTDAPLDDSTRELVRERGDAAVDALTQTLASRLTTALAAGEPGHAIDFCADEALALTDSVASGLGEGWELKRTALLARNPANEPDALELEALELFHLAEVTGSGPRPHHVQRTATGDYRYYRPLRIAPMCLACHGPSGSIDREVLLVLGERYPDDEATGYADGDLRGLVRVTIPASAIRP